MLLISEILISAGYIFFFSAAVPNIRQIIKDRRQLKGFNPVGVLLTAIGLDLTQTAFFLDAAYIPVLIGLPNLFYWHLLVFYLWKKK